ncbi:MAG: DUF4198 domain-containing protein [bacterium]|nr:DUF4198 domain-containing protein [bacterium]
MFTISRIPPKALILLALLGILTAGADASGGDIIPSTEPLWLSLSPAESTRPEAKTGKRPGSTEHSAEGEECSSCPPAERRPQSRFESEHRPAPLRRYFLNGLAPEAEGYVLHPDLTVDELKLERQGGGSASVELEMSDGPHHGAHNLYVVDREVRGETLHLRTAKWVTIQHSCGWGHAPKFNDERQVSQTLTSVPLEIVMDDLWDTNFHSTVMSGDRINLRVLKYGEPAPGARVTVISEKGWLKTFITDDEGRVAFQLVRDYYPDAWSNFHRGERGEIKFGADLISDEQGEFAGQKYDDIHLSTTFSWRYYPARREYTSLVIGLLIAVIGAGLTGVGFIVYRRRRWTGLKRLAWNG